MKVKLTTDKVEGRVDSSGVAVTSEESVKGELVDVIAPLEAQTETWDNYIKYSNENSRLTVRFSDGSTAKVSPFNVKPLHEKPVEATPASEKPVQHRTTRTRARSTQ